MEITLNLRPIVQPDGFVLNFKHEKFTTSQLTGEFVAATQGGGLEICDGESTWFVEPGDILAAVRNGINPPAKPPQPFPPFFINEDEPQQLNVDGRPIRLLGIPAYNKFAKAWNLGQRGGDSLKVLTALAEYVLLAYFAGIESAQSTIQGKK